MNSTNLSAALAIALALGPLAVGLASPASADDADAQFLSSLSYLRDTGFYVQDYDRGELIGACPELRGFWVTIHGDSMRRYRQARCRGGRVA
jgi:hypothetical protein